MLPLTEDEMSVAHRLPTQSQESLGRLRHGFKPLVSNGRQSASGPAHAGGITTNRISHGRRSATLPGEVWCEYNSLNRIKTYHPGTTRTVGKPENQLRSLGLELKLTDRAMTLRDTRCWPRASSNSLLCRKVRPFNGKNRRCIKLQRAVLRRTDFAEKMPVAGSRICGTDQGVPAQMMMEKHPQYARKGVPQRENKDQ
jgi:hypothetical protein